MDSIATRLRQGLTALLHRRPAPAFPDRWAHAVPHEVGAAWEALTHYDRHHLVNVARELEARGADTRTVLAGLLHDVGKTRAVSLPARVGAVIAKQVAPGLVSRLQDFHAPPIGLRGLHLLLTHAERGADLLHKHGMDPRVVWLVRHHEIELPDPELRALRDADDRH